MEPKTFEPTIRLVHRDGRGEMYAIDLPGDKELILLHCTEGALRGGHSHSVPEQVMVLTGEMHYHKELAPGQETIKVLKEGYVTYNAAGEVHMAEFPVDSWILEWKIGTNRTGWVNTNHQPYRALVEASGKGEAK